MNYKEKYEMALAKAREIHRNEDEKRFDMEWLFPELKESEGERIRKALIDELKIENANYKLFRDIPKERFIAWLEKQGESSNNIHYWTEEEIEPIISDYLRGAEHYGGMIGRLRCLKPKSLEKQKDINSKEYVFRPLAGCIIDSAAIQAVEQQKLGNKVVLAFNGAYIPVEEKTADDIVNEYYSWIEKQGEQKPIDYNKELKKCRENPLYFFDKYVKIKVQKPTWSEEDEKRVKQICEDLESALENFTNRKNVRGLHFTDIIKSNINWLKSLKDRLKGE